MSLPTPSNEIQTLIHSQIMSNPILLFMKGEPDFPQCGFSARAIDVLSSVGAPFAFVNILEQPDIRRELPVYAQWPTFPQLWVNGELVGGSDILFEMFQSGELSELLAFAKED